MEPNAEDALEFLREHKSVWTEFALSCAALQRLGEPDLMLRAAIHGVGPWLEWRPTEMKKVASGVVVYTSTITRQELERFLRVDASLARLVSADFEAELRTPSMKGAPTLKVDKAGDLERALAPYDLPGYRIDISTGNVIREYLDPRAWQKVERATLEAHGELDDFKDSARIFGIDGLRQDAYREILVRLPVPIALRSAKLASAGAGSVVVAMGDALSRNSAQVRAATKSGTWFSRLSDKEWNVVSTEKGWNVYKRDIPSDVSDGLPLRLRWSGIDVASTRLERPATNVTPTRLLLPADGPPPSRAAIEKEVLSRSALASDVGALPITSKKKLGEGGNALVFSVSFAGKPAVAKILVEGASDTTSTKYQRFVAEYQRLVHLPLQPNVVRFFHFDRIEILGLPFPVIVMERCEETLDAFRKRNAEPLSRERFEQIVSGILDGLAHVHKHEIVHRDIKPGNILLRSDGTPVVADFGIAWFDPDFHEIHAKLTKKGDRVANFEFSAPELREATRVPTPAADLYSVGQLVYWLFAGETIAGTNHKPISEIASDFAFLDPAINVLIQQNPANRPQSVDEARPLLLGARPQSTFTQRVESTSPPPVTIDVSFKKMKIESSEHRYSLLVRITSNLLRAQDSWKLEIDWPSDVPIETIGTGLARMEPRDRIVVASEQPLYPGEAVSVVGGRERFTIDYLFTPQVHSAVERGKVELGLVLYLDSGAPVSARKSFRELNVF